MTQSQNVECPGAFTTEQLACFERLPVRAVIAWAFGGWGAALLGPLLLLCICAGAMRRKGGLI